MRLDNVLKTLKELETKSLREGYRGDATSYAFKRYVLELLIEVAQKRPKKKRKLSSWNVFVGQYLKEGKTIKQAAEDWKRSKI